MKGRPNTARAILDFHNSDFSKSEDANKIAQMLGQINGVTLVNVNHLTEKVFVEYDQGKTSLEEIRKIMEKANSQEPPYRSESSRRERV